MKLKTILSAILLAGAVSGCAVTGQAFPPSAAPENFTRPTWDTYYDALTRGMDTYGFANSILGQPDDLELTKRNEHYVCWEGQASRQLMLNRGCLVATSASIILRNATDEHVRKWADPNAREQMNRTLVFWAVPLGEFLREIDIELTRRQLAAGGWSEPELRQQMNDEIDRRLPTYALRFYRNAELMKDSDVARYRYLIGPELGDQGYADDRLMMVFKDGKPYLGPGYVGGREIGSPVLR